MKQVIKLLAFVLFTGPLFFACKKDDNREAFVKAVADQDIYLPLDSTLLDGTASFDPDGNIVSYLWSKLSGPASCTITDPSATKTIAKNLAQGTYEFELKVRDNDGLIAKARVLVNVNVFVLPPTAQTVIAAWKPAANGLHYLKDPTEAGNEPTFNITIGWEPDLPVRWRFFIKPEGLSYWTSLSYVLVSEINGTFKPLYVASFVSDLDGQPLYSPTIYGRSNAGIDFSQKATIFFEPR
jgi:hypothetical protein